MVDDNAGLDLLLRKGISEVGRDIDNGDGTEDDHKWDIDDLNKETKALLARGALRTGVGNEARSGVER